MQINAIDFYKADHRSQYPRGTTKVYSNFTPRSNKFASTEEVVVFGIQGFIIKHLIEGFSETFFLVERESAVSRYRRRFDNALGKGLVDIQHIQDLWDLGYLPLKIKALPEGSRVGMKIPVLTVTNTLPEFFWLVNYIESFMSAELWLPMTTASIADQYRRVFDRYAKETGTPKEFVPLQGHDFSFRGMAGIEAAKLGSAGHLLSFIGTDTVPAIDYLEEYYQADSDKELVGVSVPATEHSVMCMGTKEYEIETFRRLISHLYPAGIVSIVSDTWDLWKVLDEYAPALKREIEARRDITDAAGNVVVPGKVVFRPDSGDPVRILTGYRISIYNLDDSLRFVGFPTYENRYYSSEENPDDVEVLYDCKEKRFYMAQPCLDYDDISGKWVKGEEISEVEALGAVRILWKHFGGTWNKEGFMQLDKVGLIYGDSITLQRQEEILSRLEEMGFASGNVVLGIGSFTYQYNTRDTYGFAMKATYGEVGGIPREIFKDPVTDNGLKKSATGLLRVEKENGKYVLYDRQTPEQEEQGELEVVFLDGVIKKTQSLSEIRKRLAEV